jgi:uncharacterized RDD family membrane protein YckC
MSQFTLPSDAPLSAGVLPRRFFALFLDVFVISLIGFVAAVFITIFGFFTLGLGWLAFHIIPAIPFAYYTLLIGGTGATPGQRAMGILVRQEGSLAPPSMLQAFIWTILLWLSFLFAGVPFLLVLLNPRHRAAHDIVSGLVILRADKIPC